MNLGALRAKLTDELGVDAATAQIDSAVNERYKIANARAKWRLAEVELGTTVAAQTEYTLSSAVKELETDVILIGTSEYTPVGVRDLWGLRSGRLGLSHEQEGDGVYSVDYNTSGDPWRIEIYPAPDAGGATIIGLVPMVPAELSDPADTPIFPDDLHEPILFNGAAADLLARFDERLDMSQWFEDKFNAAVEDLRRRANRRGGSGPVQIQVGGRHFAY